MLNRRCVCNRWPTTCEINGEQIIFSQPSKLREIYFKQMLVSEYSTVGVSTYLVECALSLYQNSMIQNTTEESSGKFLPDQYSRKHETTNIREDEIVSRKMSNLVSFRCHISEMCFLNKDVRKILSGTETSSGAKMKREKESPQRASTRIKSEVVKEELSTKSKSPPRFKESKSKKPKSDSANRTKEVVLDSEDDDDDGRHSQSSDKTLFRIGQTVFRRSKFATFSDSRIPMSILFKIVLQKKRSSVCGKTKGGMQHGSTECGSRKLDPRFVRLVVACALNCRKFRVEWCENEQINFLGTDEIIRATDILQKGTRVNVIVENRDFYDEVTLESFMEDGNHLVKNKKNTIYA